MATVAGHEDREESPGHIRPQLSPVADVTIAKPVPEGRGASLLPVATLDGRLSLVGVCVDPARLRIDHRHGTEQQEVAV